MDQKAEPAGKGDEGLSPPSISLPKGGGALRGVGEKFSANPVSGTGSLSVPLATSPGRAGFGPQLSLSYDSGSGNGPFGFGWSLSLPSITRKTDKGLPQYRDAEESDVFLLSGTEDLVPVLEEDSSGVWKPPALPSRDGYTIARYRPRIEGLFARIERWTRQSDGDVHWRSISRDNVLTLYGKDANSRIFDPEDDHRIFSWLICETRDDKGNAVLYEYKSEDGAGVDLTQAHQRNRGDREDTRRGANRYLKHIRYGNRTALLNAGQRPRFLTAEEIRDAGWMFEAVFDYGEHDAEAPVPRDADAPAWTYRRDPFSSYRAGFEVRTGRLCRRMLMFHHFAEEPEVGDDCLVRSTDFTYSDSRNSVYTFLRAVTQSGYRRSGGGGYLKRSLPPVEFEYTQPVVQDVIEEIDAASLENLPVGMAGGAYQWTDLHGEGIPGILTEQAGAWFYKRNVSPISQRPVGFAPLELVAVKPNLSLAGGQAQLMDLAGDGQPDLVVLDGPMPGFYEHDGEEGWQPFRPFASRLNRDTRDPNLKFVDLDGDGHADVLISEDDAFVWHPSLAEEGFGPARRVHQALDEETGPRLVFADGEQSIHLADLSGDGLTDLVRIRNGEVCYWPNLGYGRFGAKVTMDRAPWFDNPDQFEPKRIRLADIDGSGTTDIIYLHRDGVRLYFNESGNSWSDPQRLNVFPRVDDLVSIVPTDLLGNGTACLVWSSPLPGDAQRPMRYVNLMGGQKPHLLVKTINNLGAETVVQYAPSTKFYLQDKRDGTPWITRLPFPVHVVERVETYDHISRNRFVTRYAYHHGYFDGEEREFRGFGMVEQWDTEVIAALSQSNTFPLGDNIDAASHVPPVLTKTWFHTGIYIARDHVSDFFAGLLDAHDRGEYYREPAWRDDDAEARKRLLPDTVMPANLTLAEEREACRALKGSMLRQEVYALDGSLKAEHPYTVTEQNFTIERLQARHGNRHAVFFSHPREAISYHYERNPADPRIQHALTLEVDGFGNVLKEAAIGYGRRPGQSPLLGDDKTKQETALCTYTENDVTRAIDSTVAFPDDYRTPLPCETQTFELTGFTPTDVAGRFRPSDFIEPDPLDPERVRLLSSVKIPYESSAAGGKERRLIERVRTLYRMDDLTSLLDPGELEPLALPGESYKLAFTPGLLDQVYFRGPEGLLPASPADVLQGGGAARGGYVDLAGDGHGWVPAGRVFLSPDSAHTAAQELAFARRHFFLPHRYRDPFHTDAVSTESFVTYDAYDLLMLETRDPLDNRVTAGERRPDGTLDSTQPGNDYRVLQPWRVMDPNRNRTQVAFDALGMVAGTAVMGKPEESPVPGDRLTASFRADLTQPEIDQFFADPKGTAAALLDDATTRVVYDLTRYWREPDPQRRLPAFAATLARETHTSDPVPAGGLRIQVGFSYSDGFGREIQKKIQAEPEKVDGVAGPPRWVGSGWVIFNNKGKPVRQYEPFFSQLPPEHRHHFEFARIVGVSPILFYDPVERVVATLHPNHTYEKVVFDPWQQTTYDVNDTVAASGTQTGDPRTDPDVAGYVREHFEAQPAGWQTWHAQRIGRPAGDSERDAAEKATAHADTPTTAHFDVLGRPFLTFVDNGSDPARPGGHLLFATRVELDIEGNQRAVIDAKDRLVMRYDYDMLGNRVHQASMEAGERWMLNDVAGKPIRAWDSREHVFCTTYDPLRRPMETLLGEGTDAERVGWTEYGESRSNPEANNLRGQVFQLSDQAGVVTTGEYDFKGNLLRSRRRLAQSYNTTLDWSGSVPLEGEVYTSRTLHDALNRPIQSIAPHSDRPDTTVNVVQPIYNEANLLEQVHAWLNLDSEPAGLLDSATASLHAVANIDYDAKGQRVLIEYGNAVTTTYSYDPLTFRLVHLLTRREAGDFPNDCPAPPPPGWPGCQVQNLHYTYDPAGNITQIRDDAQQTVYFRNQRVEPSAAYTYDAMYRLIEATGREHLGQGGAPIPHSYNDAGRVGLLSADAGRFSSNDGNAMGRYLERYVYDAVGNFLSMEHRRDLVRPGWTRAYAYDEPSQLEAGRESNRLTSTTVGDTTESYSTLGDGYDAHGSMLRMPHLQEMLWNFTDQLQMTRRQAVNTADEDGAQHQGERTWYVYDSAGQRVRRVTELASGAVKDERIYLGGFEIYRRNGASPLVRETLHIMDDKQRIALVETRTGGNEPGVPVQLIRYQLGNHLGSASLELDDEAQIISYEEYTAYGSTSYQAVRSRTDAPKRYRYTGMERDDESGLSYHTARYYAPWLGRWCSVDPLVADGAHEAYTFVANRPSIMVDTDGKDATVVFERNEAGGYVATVNVPLVIIEPDESIRASMQGTVQGAAEWWNSQTFTRQVDGHDITIRFNVTVQALSTEEIDAIGGVAPYDDDADAEGYYYRLADAHFRQTGETMNVVIYRATDPFEDYGMGPNSGERSQVGLGSVLTLTPSATRSRTALGTARHEIGHVIGLEDLYTGTGHVPAEAQASVMARHGPSIIDLERQRIAEIAWRAHSASVFDDERGIGRSVSSGGRGILSVRERLIGLTDAERHSPHNSSWREIGRETRLERALERNREDIEDLRQLFRRRRSE